MSQPVFSDRRLVGVGRIRGDRPAPEGGHRCHDLEHRARHVQALRRAGQQRQVRVGRGGLSKVRVEVAGFATADASKVGVEASARTSPVRGSSMTTAPFSLAEGGDGRFLERQDERRPERLRIGWVRLELAGQVVQRVGRDDAAQLRRSTRASSPADPYWRDAVADDARERRRGIHAVRLAVLVALVRRRAASPSRSVIIAAHDVPRGGDHRGVVRASRSAARLDDLPVAGAGGERAEGQRQHERHASERHPDPDAPPGPRRRRARHGMRVGGRSVRRPSGGAPVEHADGSGRRDAAAATDLGSAPRAR